MAGEKTFAFEILTLQQLFLQEQVRFVIAPGQEGVFEVLPNHAEFVFALKPGPLRIRTPCGPPDDATRARDPTGDENRSALSLAETRLSPRSDFRHRDKRYAREFVPAGTWRLADLE